MNKSISGNLSLRTVFIVVILMAAMVVGIGPVFAQPAHPTELAVSLLNLDGSNIDVSLLLTVCYTNGDGYPECEYSTNFPPNWFWSTSIPTPALNGKSSFYGGVPALDGTIITITIDGYEPLEITAIEYGQVLGTYYLTNVTPIPPTTTTTTVPTTTTTTTVPTTTSTTSSTTSTTTTTIPSPSGPTPIDSCGTLNTAGETYVLQNDISSSGSCFTIGADNITLDGAGYSITGSGSGTGVYLRERSGVTIKNLNVDRFSYGIDLFYSSNNILTNNTASNNGPGIFLSQSNRNILTNNTASNNWNGIRIFYSSDSNILINNTANSNTYNGIWLAESSKYNTLINNTASNNVYGIHSAYSSNSNTLINNTASNNEYGIRLRDSGNNTLTGNTMSNNTYNFGVGFVVGFFGTFGYFIQAIDTSNTVDGKPIYYLVGVSDQVIDSSTDAGYIGVVNSVNVTVRDLTLTKNQNGVLFSNTSKSSVLNVTASNNYYGIYLRDSSNNSITDNTADSNNYGIRLSSSNNNTLTDNSASDNNQGISLSSSGNNTIYNNLFNNTDNFHLYSFYFRVNDWNTSKTPSTNIIGGPYLGGNLWATPDGDGFSETCLDRDRDGICDSYYKLASGNRDNLPLAKVVGQNSDCIVINHPGFYRLDNNIENIGATCIEITSSNVVFDGQGYTIDGVGNSGTYGVYVYNSTTMLTNITVKNLVVTDWDYGIYYRNSVNGSITNNNVNSNSQYGIYLYSSNNNSLTNNTASNNEYGILVEDSSSYNTISNNIAPNNDIGIYLDDSSNYNTLANNTANSNEYYGIYLYSSSNNTLTGNTASGNDLFGIYLDDSSYNTIESNTASGNNNGISLDGSGSNTVTNNTANLNNNYGIRLRSSSNNTLTNNTASDNKDGIYLDDSSYNTLKDNTASDNYNGIYLFKSGYNIPINNTALNNVYGIYLFKSRNNTVYNNLFNNTINFGFYDTGYSNTWNTSKTPGTNVIGGPYLGGNFWANPDGTGFSETCTDADPRDGICDSNYTLNYGNVDYLLLAVLTPSINISKVMISGKTTVYTETREYWVLEIEVINDGLTDLSSVIVSDTIPEEITLDDFTASKGSVAATVKNGAAKLTWTIGTMSPGDIETLVMDVSTKTVGSGMRTTQSFLEPGKYVLNEGASVSGNGGQITAGPTDPITVYAQTKTRWGRMGGGRHSR